MRGTTAHSTHTGCSYVAQRAGVGVSFAIAPHAVRTHNWSVSFAYRISVTVQLVSSNPQRVALGHIKGWPHVWTWRLDYTRRDCTKCTLTRTKCTLTQMAARTVTPHHSSHPHCNRPSGLGKLKAMDEVHCEVYELRLRQTVAQAQTFPTAERNLLSVSVGPTTYAFINMQQMVVRRACVSMRKPVTYTTRNTGCQNRWPRDMYTKQNAPRAQRVVRPRVPAPGCRGSALGRNVRRPGTPRRFSPWQTSC